MRSPVLFLLFWCLSALIIARPAAAQSGWTPGVYIGAAGGTAMYSGEAAARFEVPAEPTAASFELGYQFRQGGAFALRVGFQNFNAFDASPDELAQSGSDPVYVLTDPDWFSATLLVRGGSEEVRVVYPFLELGGTVLTTEATEDDRFGQRGRQIAFGPQVGFGFGFNIQQTFEFTLTASATALFPDDAFDTTFDPFGGPTSEPEEVEGGASSFIFDLVGTVQAGVRIYL